MCSIKGTKTGKIRASIYRTSRSEVLEILNRNKEKIRIKKNSRIVHPNRLRIYHIRPALNN